MFTSPLLNVPYLNRYSRNAEKCANAVPSNGEHKYVLRPACLRRLRLQSALPLQSGQPGIKYFNCSNYKGNRGTCTSTHYVRVDFLEGKWCWGENTALNEIRQPHEDEFVKAVIGHSQQAEQTDRKLKEKELKTLLARDEELDGLFERIYEDNVSGKLSDDRFAKMSRRYEDEQKELSEKIKKLRSEIEKQSSRSMTTDMLSVLFASTPERGN